MIVNVRGPCASGKSTLVRGVMDEYEISEAVFERRAVRGYKLWTADRPALHVLGNYERDQDGGTDSIKSLEQVYDLARQLSMKGHVLFEGHADNDRVKHALALHRDGFPTYVVFLSTRPEECEREFRARYDRGRHREHLGGPSEATIQRAVYRAHANMLKDQIELKCAIGLSRARWMERDDAKRHLIEILRGPV